MFGRSADCAIHFLNMTYNKGSQQRLSNDSDTKCSLVQKNRMRLILVLEVNIPKKDIPVEYVLK